MAIRDEVNEVAAELAKVGGILADDVPNKEQLSEIISAVFGVVTQGADFAAIPKEERFKAISHAFVKAGALVMDSSVSYSDEAP